MAIGSIKDADRKNFIEIDNNSTARRIRGEVITAGVNTSGKTTEVVLNSTTWTALPLTSLSSRNSLNIQNTTGIEIKLNFDNAVVTYTGIVLADGSERFYDMSDSIVLYAKAESGTPTIVVEELS